MTKSDLSAKTNQSASLRFGPGIGHTLLDQLEPGYPLLVHGEAVGWLDVTAKAKGPRTKDQRGWISQELVTFDKPIPLPPPDTTHNHILYVALAGIVAFLALLAWL